MNLILLEPGELLADGTARLADARAVHIRTVLRASAGDDLRAGIVDGAAGVARVEAIDASGVLLRCRFDLPVPARPAVDLLLALPRPKVMRRLWAQLAALGVGRIVLTNAEKVERHYFDTHVLTPECYRPLLIEGLQQARDTRLPQVSLHRQFRVLVEDDLDALCGPAERILAHPGSARALGQVAAERTRSRVLLAVGPEGGWNAFETALLERAGFVAAGMGPRTLRSDTACVAMLAIVHEALRAARPPA